MRKIIVTGFVFALGAVAQQYPRDGYRERDERGSVIERVQRDLDRAEAGSYLSGRDRHKFDHARKELWEFEKRFNRGRFDRHELDEVIGAVHSVVDNTPIRGRDREELAEDLARLRDFRGRY